MNVIQILTFFLAKLSGREEEERTTLMKSRDLRSLDFMRVALSSSSSWHSIWHFL